jgi:hypothetical protein
MLTGTGRIIVAIAGAAAVVVAGIFIIRGLIASPPPKLNAAKSSSAPAAPAPLPPGAAPSGDPGATPGDPGSSDPGSTTGSSGESSSGPSSPSGSSNPPSNSPNPGSTASPPFTATSVKGPTTIGLVTVDVDVPQVQGGKDTVAQTFNSGMQGALNGQADLLPKGKLQNGFGSGVRIGKSVLSGLLRTAYTPGTSPTPIAKASTVVVDTNTGSTLDVSSIFTDTNAGLKRLQTESQKLGPTTSSAGNKFNGATLQADQTTFAHWTAENSGMRVLFNEGAVAPSSQGIVELTIPWANLKDLLKPGVLDTLSG